VNFKPAGDDEEFVFAPPDGAGIGNPTPGGSLSAGAIPPPAGVAAWLPTLQMAANDPQATPQVKALFALVTHHMSEPQGQ
jgi:hypothetical protein